MKKKLKVTQEVKDTWIEALRSGEYAQTRGTLRRLDDYSEGFCCLGVLNDVCAEHSFWYDQNLVVCSSDADKKRIIRRKTDDDGKPIESHHQYAGMKGVEAVLGDYSITYEVNLKSPLPQSVSDRLRLSADLTLRDFYAASYLANLNDNKGLSFDEIADFLEENLIVEDEG